MNSMCLPKLILLWLVVISVLVGRPAKPTLAGPPAPVTFTITQPDGVTNFEARTWGNELSNGTETVDGYTVLQNPNTDTWFYAEVDSNSGQLKATDKIAGKDSPPASSFHARPQATTFYTNQRQIMAQGPIRVASVPALVVLTRFTDQAPLGSTETDWATRFFGASNSVQDYYQEVSYNQLTLTPAIETCGINNNGIVDWVNTGTPHPNSDSETLTQNALTAADSCVNYTTYDTNGDNIITPNELLVIIVAAGYEAGFGDDLTPVVWGHQSSYWGGSPLDGITGFTYAQFGEWHGSSNDNPGHLATIGIMVHEVGHLLGWPDLYDIDGTSGGVGEWSVMSGGMWNSIINLGDSPAHPSAWEKWYQGWLTPIKITTRGTPISIFQAETNKDNSVIQLLDNPNGVDWSFAENSGTGEYFLVENRQQTGYDIALPGCGLLIWHIDETRSGFNNNANADENRRLIDLEEADGNNDLDNFMGWSDPGDPYPGISDNTTFTDTSNPNNNLYSEAPSNVAVTNISTGCTDPMIATFSGQPKSFSLTVNIVGDGFVTPNPDWPTYLNRTNVTLTAIPSSEWDFAGWSGDVYGTVNPSTIIMDSDKFITVTFQKSQSPPPPHAGCDYIVQDGDWVFKIARRFSVSPGVIIKANHLYYPNYIYPGQCLIIPKDWQ